VDAKGEILWEALLDDCKVAKEVEVVKLLVSEYGVRQFICFQGQWTDEETGFYHNRHRFYDPAMGRYISQDPIGFRGGVNLYAYAENPVDWVDPLGLMHTDGRTLSGGILEGGGDGILVLGAMATVGVFASKDKPTGLGNCPNGQIIMESRKTSRLSGKYLKDDIPNWAIGKRPDPNEDCDEFARKALLEQYGINDTCAKIYKTDTEFSRIKKNCLRKKKFGIC
jgi:RHS repeat-associated protein